MVNFFLPRGEFCLRTWTKINRFNFLTCNWSSCNINTINVKLFLNHGGIYRFDEKFKKHSGEINLTCTFILLLLNPFDLPRYRSESRKIYTLRLLLLCLEALRESFSFFPERECKGLSGKLLHLVELYQWIWILNLYQNLIMALLIVAVYTMLF